LGKELGWDSTPSTSATYSTTSTLTVPSEEKKIEDAADDPKKIQQLEKQIYRINRYRTISNLEDGPKGNSSEDSSTIKSTHRGTVFGRHYNVDVDSYNVPCFPKTPEQYDFLYGLLQDDFLFQNPDDREQTEFIGAMRNEKIAKGTQLSRQGDLSDFFCIVETGVIEFVENNDEVVGTCKAGESFGELELILDAEQSVSTVAKSAVSLWKVDQRTFHEMLASHDRNNQQQMKDWIRKVSLFENMTPAAVTRLTKNMVPVKWPAGARFFQKNEEALVLYIIKSGTVRVHDMGLGD
jgi:cAMP-dependent protein kinase regulator